MQPFGASGAIPRPAAAMAPLREKAAAKFRRKAFVIRTMEEMGGAAHRAGSMCARVCSCPDACRPPSSLAPTCPAADRTASGFDMHRVLGPLDLGEGRACVAVCAGVPVSRSLLRTLPTVLLGIGCIIGAGEADGRLCRAPCWPARAACRALWPDLARQQCQAPSEPLSQPLTLLQALWCLLA